MKQYRPVPGSDGCGTCRHYAPAPADHAVGECRISRPRIGDDTRIGLWPLVQGSAFCGEYERRYEVVKTD